MKYCFVSFICLFSVLQTQAQISGTGLVKGKVVDSVSVAPLGFASIQIISSADKKLVNGTVTPDAGDFNVQVPYGRYYAVIEFMGYNSFQSSEFNVSSQKSDYDFGIIKLGASTNTLDEVIVQAEKSTMELSLDKKIFNVGQDLANAGGSASDILTNIPSVSVDPEGNVRLRGSDNVRILIDGKPSGLVSFKGGSGLQQLQGSMIERVEVITNPSARYEAEGMAGIINIVLKKNNAQGFNGSFEVITGYPTNLGAAANLNYRHRKINFFINYSIAYRKQPNSGSLYQEVYDDDTTFISRQNSRGDITGFNNNIRGGLDYYFSDKNILTASYLFRRSDVNRITDIRYEDYLFSSSNMRSYTLRRQDEDEVEPNSEYSLIYKRTFAQKDHTLTGEIKLLDNWESSQQLFTENHFEPGGTENTSLSRLEQSLNDESEKQWLFQADYIRPIGKEGKFETGVRSSFRDMINDYVVSKQSDEGTFDPLPGLDNVFLYDENIHAAYGILGNKHKKVSYQAGLRAEWTDVKTTLQETNEVNPRRYANLFPSAHFTIDLGNDNAIQMSYSRRVRRPFYNDLSPFMTFSDRRNFSSGNPDLDPEFSNIYEVGHIKYFEKGSISSSVYYRSTDGKIERIRTPIDDINFRTLPQNLNSEKATGLDFAGEYALTNWWKLDMNFNFFYAEIDGSNILETYRTTTYSWFARQTSRFSLPKKLDIQLRGNFEAPQKTVQGERKALYFVDLSTSKDILGGRGTVNLNILDVFNTRKMRSITEGPGINNEPAFYSEGKYQFRRRQINLTINYRIKQAKQAKKPATSED